MTAEFEPWDNSLEAFEDMDEEIESLRDYIEVLEAYVEYVKAKIEIDEVPFCFEDWLEIEEESGMEH